MSSIVSKRYVTDYPSASKPALDYYVCAILDDDEHTYLSCDCPSWIRGRQQAGKQAWERHCKHTEKAALDFPNWQTGESKPKPTAPRDPQNKSRFDNLEVF